MAEPESEARCLGRFDLLEEVGAGGFGSVWRARDRELGRIVAVKIAYRNQISAFEAEEFFHEARATAKLSHPNIVKVLELGYEDGQAYIVNEFVDGPNLGKWLEIHPVTPREAAQLSIHIANSLDHAHQAGIIHRDLKPSNILIAADGAPHLVDFGLAKREPTETSITLEGRVLGTPAYMAPEQAQGESDTADHRADVYSLGVVLFEMLTGDRPFRGNISTLLQQVIEQDAPSPRTLNASVPRELEAICLKCLAKDRRRRYESAAYLADDLQRFLDGKPIEARPITIAARGWRWCVRNPLFATMVAVLGGLLIALAIVGPLVAIQQRNLAQKHEDARAKAEKEQQRSELIYLTAEEYYRRAIDLLEKTVSGTPENSEQRRELALIYNDLAWVLVTSPDLELHAAENAVDLAGMAVHHMPDFPASQKTLGLACYRAGKWQEADVLRDMGADIALDNVREIGGEPIADITVRSSVLRGIEIGGETIPRLIDELPVLVLAAAFARGTTAVCDAAELRVKETNRIDTTATELRKLGVHVEGRPDGFVIEGSGRLQGAIADSHGDHRLAMTLAIAGLLASGETIVRNAACIDDSFPRFEQTLTTACGGVS